MPQQAPEILLLGLSPKSFPVLSFVEDTSEIEDNSDIFQSLISESEIPIAPKLKITHIESQGSNKNNEICINAGGLEQSQRLPKKGSVYIGLNNDSNEIIITESDSMAKQIGIRYSAANKKYYLEDLGEGTGLFAKIQAPVKIKNGTIISFGNSIMVLQIDKLSNNIILKFIEGPKAEMVFTFSIENGDIQIGRMPDCKIMFNHTSLSRYQTLIRYIQGVG